MILEIKKSTCSYLFERNNDTLVLRNNNDTLSNNPRLKINGKCKKNNKNNRANTIFHFLPPNTILPHEIIHYPIILPPLSSFISPPRSTIYRI